MPWLRTRRGIFIEGAEMEILKIKSSAREQMVEITSEVQKAITNSGVSEGICLLFSQHTTAGLTVNENADPDVQRDILHALRTLIPQHGMGFHHGEENSDSHLKTSLAGPGLTLPIAGGKLALGRWQGVFLCEFDGPRERKVSVTVVTST
jgi:secondary thiamine-phosphate synthase enzyme